MTGEEAQSMLKPTKRSRAAAAVAAAGILLISAAASEARVASITITSTTPAFSGRVFGDVGAYEQVIGSVRGITTMTEVEREEAAGRARRAFSRLMYLVQPFGGEE